MKLFFQFLLVVCYTFSQSISLSETTDLSYKGKIGVDYWSFPNDANNATQPDFQTRFFGSLDFTLQGDFPYQIRLNTRFLFDTENQNYDRYEVDDLYIDYFSDSYEIRAGYQIFSWKTVESVSHADFLNQTDLEGDIFDPDKFGELAIRFRYIPKTETEQTFELYYLPYFRTTHLPKLDNRFSFGLPIDNTQSLIQYHSRHKKWRPQIAVRYQTILFDDIDANLFYFNGYNRFPALIPNIQYTHQYQTINKTGLTFQGELGNWLVKGEFVYNKYEHKVRNQLGEFVLPEYLSYTTGFEYTLYSPLVSDQDLGIIFEVIGDTDSGKNPAEVAGFRPFQNHAFVGLRYAFNNISDRSILIGSFVDYKEDNIIAQIEYEERILNTFKLKLTYNFLNPTTQPLVGFKNNDRFKLNLSYHF